MPLYSSFFGRWSDRIAIPMLEIGINVAEKISSPRKRFLTIGRRRQELRARLAYERSDADGGDATRSEHSELFHVALQAAREAVLAMRANGFQSEYEKTRITEIGARAALYRLKFQKLNGQVLDWKLLVGELTAIFSSIREIILASSMTKREKDDCLRNLAEIPVVLENVAAKQNKAEKDPTGTHQNGGDDLD